MCIFISQEQYPGKEQLEALASGAVYLLALTSSRTQPL